MPSLKTKDLTPEKKDLLKKYVLEGIEEQKRSKRPVTSPSAKVLPTPLISPIPKMTLKKITPSKPTINSTSKKIRPAKMTVKPAIKSPGLKPVGTSLKMGGEKKTGLTSVVIPSEPRASNRAEGEAEESLKKQDSKGILFDKLRAGSRLRPALGRDAARDDNMTGRAIINARTKNWRLMVWGVIIAIIIFIAVDLGGLYVFGWQDVIGTGLARAMSLPAGTVNGRPIKLADYLDDLKILKLAVSENREGVKVDSALGQSTKEDIFSRLAAIELINSELKKYKNEVTKDELNKKLDDLIVQMGGQKPAEATTQELYHLNLNQFADKVLLPLIAKDKLQAAISQDESLMINKTAKEKAEKVLLLAKEAKTDFGALAKQYTDDGAGINVGGDLGWINKGEVASELEKVLFSLSDNTVYGELIKNRLGYHILKLEKKSVNPENGQESVRARHILIKVDVDQYLKELMASAKIKKFVR